MFKIINVKYFTINIYIISISITDLDIQDYLPLGYPIYEAMGDTLPSNALLASILNERLSIWQTVINSPQ